MTEKEKEMNTVTQKIVACSRQRDFIVNRLKNGIPNKRRRFLLQQQLKRLDNEIIPRHRAHYQTLLKELIKVDSEERRER
jgi:hypothetical protein